MKITIGDHMYVTDDNLEGKVVGIKEDKVVLLCDDGFEYEFFTHQVFKKGEDNNVERSGTKDLIALEQPIEQINYPEIKLTPRITKLHSGQVFDLHIEDLAPQLSFSNAHEALLFQLRFVREVIHTAQQKRVRRVVFVHGIGRGRLRNELRKMIAEEFTAVEYFDGDYQKFGHGATEINIHQFF